MDKILSTSLALAVVGALAFTSAGASGDTAQCTAAGAAPAASLAEMSASIEPASLAGDVSLVEGQSLAASEGGVEADGSLPETVRLRPIPARYAAGYAIYERYGYAVFDGDELIVDPVTRQIIARLR
jgi:hypothetical protein